MYKTIVNTANDFAIISKKTVQFPYEQKSEKNLKINVMCHFAFTYVFYIDSLSSFNEK